VHLVIFLLAIYILGFNAVADVKTLNAFWVFIHIILLVYSIFGMVFFAIEFYEQKIK
jgi:ABC-type multidrug transport system permease subunit